MKTKFAGLTLATAALLQAGSPSIAGGDVIYTGVKDPYATVVPVPAPAPIPVYEPEYYVRFDTGAAWLSDGSLDEIGSAMEIDDIGDTEVMEFGSIGAGRYITPSLRVELAVDLFTRADLASGDFTFNEIVDGPGGPGDPVPFTVTRRETVKFEQDLGMLNFYYDFRNRTSFTPYVGGGIGVTYRQLTRRASESALCTFNCASVPVNPVIQSTSEDSDKRWDFAAAAMAGVAIQISDSILWDTSYRYLWQDGGLSVAMPTVAGPSTAVLGSSRIEIDDIGQHQVRTGIRLNLN